MTCSSWIKYLIISLIQSVLLSQTYRLLNDEGAENLIFRPLNFVVGALPVLALYVCMFALNEKVRKEQFVIGVTNSKTKKLALQLINHMPTPVALVSKKGQILFCNNQFEQML